MIGSINLPGNYVTMGVIFLFFNIFKDFPVVFLAYLIAGIASTHYAVFLSAVLDPKDAVDVGTFLSFFLGLNYFIATALPGT